MQDSILYIVLSLLCLIIYLLLSKKNQNNNEKNNEEMNKLKESLTNSFGTELLISTSDLSTKFKVFSVISRFLFLKFWIF